MKHTIEYNLPEETEELNHHMRAVDYYCALWDIREMMIALNNDKPHRLEPALAKAYEKLDVNSTAIDEFLSVLTEEVCDSLNNRGITL